MVHDQYPKSNASWESAVLKDFFRETSMNLHGGMAVVRPGDVPLAGDEKVRRGAPDAEMLDALMVTGDTVLGITHRNGAKGDNVAEVAIVRMGVGSRKVSTIERVSTEALRRPDETGVVTPWRDITLTRDRINPDDDAISRLHGVVRVYNDGRVEILDGVPSEGKKESTNGTIAITGKDLMRYNLSDEAAKVIGRMRANHESWQDETLRIRSFGKAAVRGFGLEPRNP